MSYLDTGGEVDATFSPWPNYPPPTSFRVGMTPAVCNNFFVTTLQRDAGQSPEGAQKLISICDLVRDAYRGTINSRTFVQNWTTGRLERDAPDVAVKNLKKDEEYEWDVDQADTSETNSGVHAWEIAHVYDGDPGGKCTAYSDGQRSCAPINDDFMWDLGHRIVLANWSEWNCVAGAFLSHPHHFSMTDQNINDDTGLAYIRSQGLLNPTVLRRGDFLMRVQGMDDNVSFYDMDVRRENGWKQAIQLSTQNGAAMSEDFSTGGFYMPVLTMADNPFWRADPSAWVPILQTLKMDVMPYCAPLRKTRPVMYRFWDSPYSTALYGGPNFHCATMGGNAGADTGDILLANVPYYRKFLRDFMASDDSIMAWRSSIGLPENDEARYPHNYANYWKVVQALEGECNANGKSIWSDGGNVLRTPTEFIGDHYASSYVGKYYEYINPTTPGVGDSRANHFVLWDRDADPEFFKFRTFSPGSPNLSAGDTTLAYPTTFGENPATKLSMNQKRKVHQVNMHATHDLCYRDYFATFFHSGSWDISHLNHEVHSSNVGVVSDAGMALLDDYMSHIINGADITDLLPDGIALEDKMALSGWFNNELTNLVLTSLENAKLTRLNEFRKWVLKNGKSLSQTQFRAWCKYIAKAYPRLEKTIQAFFDGLERAFGEFDITMMSGGTAFAKAMSQAFTKAGVEASSVALAEALAAIKKAGDAATTLPPAVWKKFTELIGKVKAPPTNLFDYIKSYLTVKRASTVKTLPTSADDSGVSMDTLDGQAIDMTGIYADNLEELDKFFQVDAIQDIVKSLEGQALKMGIADPVAFETLIVKLKSDILKIQFSNIKMRTTFPRGAIPKDYVTGAVTPEEQVAGIFNVPPDLPPSQVPLAKDVEEIVKIQDFEGDSDAPFLRGRRGAASLEEAAKNAETVENAAAPAADIQKAAAALDAVEKEVTTAAAQVAPAAVEAVEGLTLSSIAAEAAPLILMFAFSEVLDYFIQKAEKEAEEAAAYKAAHDEMNAFYEGKVYLNTEFFTASEIARIQTRHFDDKNLSWGSPTERPWVRFDLLTRLIVNNTMCLAMVDETWRKSEMGYDKQQLVIHIRQTEWLSTCEAIRVLRLLDYSIRAPMWKDAPEEDAEHEQFSKYHFPFTDTVPNGMIREFMTPIPCLTPLDNPLMMFNLSKDLYGSVYGASDEEVWLMKDSPIYARFSVQQGYILPDNWKELAQADLATKNPNGRITGEYLIDRDSSDNTVMYYYTDGRTVYSPDSDDWEYLLTTPRFTKYGTVPTPYVTVIRTIDPLTGLPKEVKNIVEPVPVFAPDKSPTMFISSADPTFAWPTLRERGGPMNFIVKELHYFDTHKIHLTGDDGVNLSTVGESAIGKHTSRLILQPTPIIIEDDAKIVVLIDNPEYSREKWERVKRALNIGEQTTYFLQASLEHADANWRKYNWPHPLRLIDNEAPSSGSVISYPNLTLEESETDPTTNMAFVQSKLPPNATLVKWELITTWNYQDAQYNWKFTWEVKGFPLAADGYTGKAYIFDFASSVDWMAFMAPSPEIGCGYTLTADSTTQEYHYFVISEKDFDMSQWGLFPDMITYIAAHEDDFPPELVNYFKAKNSPTYEDYISGLCIWPAPGPRDDPGRTAPTLFTRKIDGLNLNQVGTDGNRVIQNMSALDVAFFTFKNLGGGKEGLNPPIYLAPGDVHPAVQDDTTKFVVILKGEIDDDVDPLDPWKEEFLYDPDKGIGNVHRSLIVKNDISAAFYLLILDNPHFNVSPKLTKLKARFSQIIEATAGMKCYAILRYFIETQFMMHVQLKPPSKDQEDICSWLLNTIHIHTDGGVRITPRTIRQQIALYNVGSDLTHPTRFDEIYSADYDVDAFFKAHPGFAAPDTECIESYGAPTIPNGGLLFGTELSIREGRGNPTQWAEKYAYLGFGEEPDTQTLKELLITIGTDALKHNEEFVDDVMNNRLTDLEALPKCKAAASQHGELVHLLHLAEKLRNLRVDILMKDRAEKEDEMLMDVERRLEETVNSNMWGGPIDEAGQNFLLMLKNLGAIRDHRTVVDKSALHTLNNHEALCAQACKESYNDDGRAGLRTGTSLHYYIPDISSAEMAYFYNPHNQNLLVACRGTSVGKDLEKADIDVEPLQDPGTYTPAGIKKWGIDSIKRKLSAAVSPMSDLYTDFMIVVGKQDGSPRHKKSLDEVNDILKKYVVKSVTVTGHSLGGSIAVFIHQQLFLSGVESTCVIFNAGIGLDKSYFDMVAQEKSGSLVEWAKHLTTFHIAGESGSIMQSDPVSFLSGGIGDAKRQKAVTGAGVPTRLAAHSLSNFISDSVVRDIHDTYTLPTR
jgi:hypothetical protein